ncbi:DUF1672 family protein [Staphylococcus simulans]
MKKILSTVIISALLLGGCDNMNNVFTKKVPDTMPVNKYKGQGFQPRADKDAIELAKKHKEEFAELGERFYKDNFGLKVKATNVVGSGKGAEVFVHCDDHDIVFNSSIVISADSLGYKGSARAQEESDDLSTLIGDVVSGFDYKANKKEYDELYQYFKDNQKKYGYYGYTKEAINKTQNSGYQNEFFWINGNPMSLKDYHEKLYPLITEEGQTFKHKYYNVQKALYNKPKFEITTNLFSRDKNYNRNSMSKRVLKISDDIENSIPKEIKINILATDCRIHTNTARYNQNYDHRVEWGINND